MKIDEECHRCGYCCSHYAYCIITSDEEWKRLVEHLEQKYGIPATVTLWEIDEMTNRRVMRDYIVQGNEYQKKLQEDFFWILDSGEVPCPFLGFDYKNGLYGCEIHDNRVRSHYCANYFCNSHEDFGMQMDCCTSCVQVEAIQEVEHDPAPEDLIPPCERGKGCGEFISRVQFFYAYAIRHPREKDVLEKAKYFKDLIEKNMTAFVTELNTIIPEIDDDCEIERNLEPYMEVLDAISRFV